MRLKAYRSGGQSSSGLGQPVDRGGFAERLFVGGDSATLAADEPRPMSASGNQRQQLLERLAIEFANGFI